ncbi:MAG: HD domain-containing protein, partial [Rubrivivax sp.]
MKTRNDALAAAEASAIVAATAGPLVDATDPPAGAASARETGPASRDSDPSAAVTLPVARAFAEQLLVGHHLDTGEPAWSHAEGVADILRVLGAVEPLQAAAYLVYAADFLQEPGPIIERRFGRSFSQLVELTRRLVQVQRAAREAGLEDQDRALQTERVRKMLLAFSRDLRVVLLRLASRLQTLRWYAAQRKPCPPVLALESREVFAALANRLGIGQVKWELEDLAFRLLEPEHYHAIARRLDQTRSARELAVDFVRHQLAGELRRAGIEADVAGRPKHLYSIWKKMRGKQLA